MRWIILLIIFSGCGVKSPDITESLCSDSNLIGEYTLEDESLLVFTKDCTYLQKINGEIYSGYYADYNIGSVNGLVKIDEVWMKYDVRKGITLEPAIIPTF